MTATNTGTLTGRPEYIRLPKPGQRDPLTGLSRTALYELISGPRAPVKSVSVKKRYAVKGIRLIHVASLLDHLASFASNGAAGPDHPDAQQH